MTFHINLNYFCILIYFSGSYIIFYVKNKIIFGKDAVPLLFRKAVTWHCDIEMIKTNAMRLLSAAKIKYETVEYSWDESDLSGVHIANELGVAPEQVFKTLVTKGEKNGYAVFCIPVDKELDLKKCAVAAKDKRVEMLPLKELLPLTGYVRGGCSPIGMKKKFPTFIDETAILFDKIYVSAGARGAQFIIAPDDLRAYVEAVYADLVKDQ